MEALSIVRDKAWFIEAETPRSRIVSDTLKAYLNRADPFSDFLSRDEFIKIKALDDITYVGIGMEIKKDRQGRVICFPYPTGPAARSGIRSGDRLERIDGVGVETQSLFTIAARTKGKRGTPITVEVTTPQGIRRRITIAREEVAFDSVPIRRHAGLKVIEISAFTWSTKDRLGRVLEDWPPRQPVVIDLRANSGGDLNAAIDASMFFLDAHARVVTITGRDGNTVYRSGGNPMALPAPVYLWQSDTTASAAEVFLAALTENGKGISIGRRSFGKGTKQDIIPLSDGSALILTTGIMLTPSGKAFDGIGLAPMLAIEGKALSTADYVAKVKEHLAAKN